MKAWAVVAALLLVGCVEEEEVSPFVGEWRSSGTGAEYRLMQDGECRYINSAELGVNCEWEPLEGRKARFRTSDGQYFVEMEAMLVGGEMLVTWPGGADTFAPDG